MKMKAINILLKMGMPAGIKGFHYIVDALCLMDSNSDYVGGNIIEIYAVIASRNNTTNSRVERAIRHAFEQVRKHGNPENVNKYLGNQKPTNGNLLNMLFLQLMQEE